MTHARNAREATPHGSNLDENTGSDLSKNQHFRVQKEKEIRKHGEYRTQRLVLAAWDRMEANYEFKAMGM